MVNRGEISAEEAAHHPSGNVLMGCLGTERDPPVDTRHLDALDVGDALLACSDGLWHYFSSEELARTIEMLSAREACEFLVNKARTRAQGSGDNLSLVIVKLEPLSTT
jgi:serine/threonine protein phosphatase PrpC